MKKFVATNKNRIKKNVDVIVQKLKSVVMIFFNVVNCNCELRKAAKLVVEECKEINDDIKNNCIMQNKTITLVKKKN